MKMPTITNADIAHAVRRGVVVTVTVKTPSLLWTWWGLRAKCAVVLVRLACWVGGMGLQIGKEKNS